MLIKYCALSSILPLVCLALRRNPDTRRNDSRIASGCVDVYKNDFLFNSYGEGIQLSLNAKDDVEPEWLVAIYKLSELDRPYPFIVIHYFLTHELDSETNDLESCINSSKKNFKSEDGYILTMLRGKSSSVNMTFQENGMYCYYGYNNLVDESTLSFSINHPNSSRSSRNWLELYTGLLSSFVSLLAILLYRFKWSNENINMNISFRIIQMICLYYIPCFVFNPIIAHVIPLVPILQLDGIFRRGVQLTALTVLKITVLKMSKSLMALYGLLVSRGFDVLPKDQFPLFSKRYRAIWIFTGLEFVVFSWFFLTPYTRLGIALGLIRILLQYFFAIYMSVAYFGTKKFLASKSLVYPVRIKIVLAYCIWTKIRHLLGVICSILYYFLIRYQVQLSRYSGLRDPFGVLFADLSDSLLIVFLLNRYWTPEAIQADSNGLLTVERQTVELDDVKTD